MIVGVDNSAAIAQQEIFGPVLVILPFDDDDEAVRIANDSVFGLAGAVMSRSAERGMTIARRVRTGSFGVNGGMFYGADAPFGGYKSSGVGRQCGIEGFRTVPRNQDHRPPGTTARVVRQTGPERASWTTGLRWRRRSGGTQLCSCQRRLALHHRYAVAHRRGRVRQVCSLKGVNVTGIAVGDRNGWP